MNPERKLKKENSWGDRISLQGNKNVPEILLKHMITRQRKSTIDLQDSKLECERIRFAVDMPVHTVIPHSMVSLKSLFTLHPGTSGRTTPEGKNFMKAAYSCA